MANKTKMGGQTPADNPQRASGDSNLSDFNETEMQEVEIGEYLKAARKPIEVTKLNKALCSGAFAVLIIFILGYVAGLIYFHIVYSVIVNNKHFFGPTIVMYCIMGSDFIDCCIGIWTCLRKTGPQPMIFACVWLLLSSLIAGCDSISLVFETNAYRRFQNSICTTQQSRECNTFMTLKIYLWCALILTAIKLVCIVLCCFNYPQVFNWLIGKDVYVDEEVLADRAVVTKHIGGGFFDPPDIARLAARGSFKDTDVIEGMRDCNAIFVTRRSLVQDEEGPSGDIALAPIQRLSRVSAFVNV